ncbi:hypothetical protein ABG067_005571 [Albugo candida]
MYCNGSRATSLCIYIKIGTASYSWLEVAESDVNTFAKVHGYALSRAQRKAKREKSERFGWEACTVDAMGYREAAYLTLRRSKSAVHGRLLFNGSTIQNTQIWFTYGTLWLQTPNIMDMIPLLMHRSTRETERLIPSRRGWFQI